MKTFNLKVPLLFILLVGAVLSVGADCSCLNYSGRILPVSKTPFGGKESMTMTFRLYNSPTGGTVLWGRQYQVLVDTNGAFRVTLSQGNDGGKAVEGAQFVDLPDALATEGPFYLGLVPDDREGTVEREFSPRQLLGGVVAVERAATAASVDAVQANQVILAGSSSIYCRGAMTTRVCRVTGSLELSGGAKAVYDPRGTGLLTVAHGTFAGGRDLIRFKDAKVTPRRIYGILAEPSDTYWYPTGSAASGALLAFTAQAERAPIAGEESVPNVYGPRITYEQGSQAPRLPARLGTVFLQAGQTADNSWNRQLLGERE